MLFGQQRGRHQHGHLLASAGGGEGGAHGHLGLAEADVAADHAVHRLAAGQGAQGGVDRGQLVRGLLERETGRERFVHRAVHLQCQAGTRLAAGLDLQQFGGHRLIRCSWATGTYRRSPLAYSISRNSPGMPPTSIAIRPR
ncbi:hypothetical protein G6F68_014055 [Rhizopus microsporus]|nr:hypothetical protein G6F68_014055 [Rhizopus microsporus]